MLKTVVIFLFSLTLISCGKNSSEKDSNASDTNLGTNSSSNSFSFTYEYRELSLRGQEICTTGKHVTTSPEMLCAELVNHKNNNHCAEKFRARTFSERCPNQKFKPDYYSRNNLDKTTIEDSYEDEIQSQIDNE